MKKSNRHWLSLLILLALSFTLSSQDDSLVYYYNHTSPRAQASAVRLLKSFTPRDSLRAKRIGIRINAPENRVAFFRTTGKRFYSVDDYDNARYYYTIALKEAKACDNKNLIGEELKMIGDMYRLQDHNTIALKYLFEALGIFKELNNEDELSNCMSLIGDIDRCVEQYSDALKYGNDALELAIKIKSIDDQTFCYSSLGSTYQELEQYGKAYDSFKKGLALATKINDTMRIIDFEYSIADMLIDQQKADAAIPYLNNGVALCKITDDQYHLAFCYTGLSKAFVQQKKYAQSVEEGLKAYQLGESMNASGFNIEAAEVLYKAYSGLNDYKNAFFYLKMVKDDDDSTTNTSVIKQQAKIELSFQAALRQKQDSLIRLAQENQKDVIHHAELDRQKTFAIAGIIGLLMALAIVFIVFRYYRKEKRSRQIINKQKLIVDLKNKEIVDSINYAKKIQQAIIPTEAEVKNIFPESFVLLLPKDIVSGDFYWITEKENFVFLAVADCTGHGVPGGFMSMLGTALLNEIINDKNIYEPADILDLLKLKIILALRQSDNTNENKDGMDIALIRLDKRTKQLTFSGANNSLYIARKGVLKELKGDKHPIGFSFNTENIQFKQQEFALEKEDVLYMFTDGYPDQFGGPHGKKFKHRQLEELLLKICGIKMEEQHKQLVDVHDQWKGNLEQVDDICIAGIRI